MGLIESPDQDWSQYTLVDIIGQISSLGVATIAKVKSAAQNVWNGIKNGVKFLADFVLLPIAEAFRTLMVNTIESLLQVVATFLTINN